MERNIGAAAVNAVELDAGSQHEFTPNCARWTLVSTNERPEYRMPSGHVCKFVGGS